MLCEGGSGSHLPDSTLRRIWGTDPASKGVRPLSIQKSRHPAAQMSTSAPHPGRQESHVKGCMQQDMPAAVAEKDATAELDRGAGICTAPSSRWGHASKHSWILPKCLTCASNALRVCHQLGRHELRGTFRINIIL